jgi:DNA helicase-2/ATP-dependent DNA helicase PcrA
VVISIVQTIKYEDYIKSIEFDLEKVKERMQNINELINSIKAYEDKNQDATLFGYLQEVALYTDAMDDDATKHEAVLMMTIHASKGTEFPVVFVVGLNEGVFPAIKSNSIPDIEEERRVAYVAVTRAMKKLYLTSNTGFSPMANSVLIQSRFIKDIGTENFIKDKQEFVKISNQAFD